MQERKIKTKCINCENKRLQYLSMKLTTHKNSYHYIMTEICDFTYIYIFCNFKIELGLKKTSKKEERFN